MLFLLIYTENEQQSGSAVQHLTAEVLGSIWRGLSKRAGEWKYFYFAIKQFPKVIQERPFPLQLHQNTTKNSFRSVFFISCLLLSPVYAISFQSVIFFSPVNMTELLLTIKKLITLANQKPAIFDGAVYKTILLPCSSTVRFKTLFLGIKFKNMIYMIFFTVWSHPKCKHGCLIGTCQTKLFSGHLVQPRFWTSIPLNLMRYFKCWTLCLIFWQNTKDGDKRLVSGKVFKP